MVRMVLPIPLPRRQPSTTPRARGLRGVGLCCPISHLLVVVANMLQLMMMVCFLSLLLAGLEGRAPSLSWFYIFTPLWISDSITLINSGHEFYRVSRARPEGFTSQRNALIAQLNRIKGSLGVATFKFLLAMRQVRQTHASRTRDEPRLCESCGSVVACTLGHTPLSPSLHPPPARAPCLPTPTSPSSLTPPHTQDGIWPSLSIVAACSPYFVAAALRLGLHMLKKPVTPIDGSSARPMRPGTPFNPVHPVILMLACRADGLNAVSWTATFWPLWTVFGLLGIASVAATVLAVGILVARDPPDHGQRALFFLCYAFLLTVTVTGLTFLVALSERLDGNVHVSYTLILAPLISGYSLLLLFYLVFTIFLPPLLLRDLNAAAQAEEEAETAEEENGVSGVIEAVSQQLAPPVLVQQSSTLFRRMGNSQMFERFLPIAPSSIMPNAEPPEAAPATSSTTARGRRGPGATELTVAESEHREAASLSTARSTGVSRSIISASAGDLESGGGLGLGGAPGGGATPHGLEEYDALEKDIEDWVRSQQEQQQQARVRKPRPDRRKAGVAPAAPDATLVPAEIKGKLRRLMSLKEQLAAAACAEACGASYETLHGAVIASSRPSKQQRPAETHVSHAVAATPPRASARINEGEDDESAEDVEAPAGTEGGAAEWDITSAPNSPEPCATPRPRVASRQLGLGVTDSADAADAKADADADDDDDAADEVDAADEASGTAGAVAGTNGLGDSTAVCEAVDEGEGEEEDVCAICFTGPRDAVLLECGHGGICYTCAKRCLRKKGRECPMCRAPVEQVVQIRLDGVPSSPQHTGVVRVKQAGLPDEIDIDGPA